MPGRGLLLAVSLCATAILGGVGYCYYHDQRDEEEEEKEKERRRRRKRALGHTMYPRSLGRSDLVPCSHTAAARAGEALLSHAPSNFSMSFMRSAALHRHHLGADPIRTSSRILLYKSIYAVREHRHSYRHQATATAAAARYRGKIPTKRTESYRHDLNQLAEGRNYRSRRSREKVVDSNYTTTVAAAKAWARSVTPTETRYWDAQLMVMKRVTYQCVA